LQLTVKRTRETLRHQRYRAEDVRRDLGLHPGEPDIYGITVNLMPFDYSLRFAGHAVRIDNLSNGPVDELSIAVYERQYGSDVRIDFDANPAHYSKEELAAHQRRFLLLLRRLSASPNVPCHRLEVLTPEERRQILVEWNDTARSLPCTTIAALFEAQVARTPEAAAIMLDEQRVSYADLNRQANRLAHELRKRSVGPDVVVGVYIERSVEFVVALLGILKAGGAYLPLDLAFPRQRIEFMLADSQAELLLTSVDQRPEPGEWALESLRLDELLPVLTDGSGGEENLAAPGLGGDELAYVIYTSGTTGVPKGIAVPQRAVLRLVLDPDYVTLQPGDLMVQASNTSFDAATFEIWGALLNGGVLVMLPAGRSLAEEIIPALNRHRIDTLWLTAGLFQEIVDSNVEALAGVGQLLAGGDVLSAEHVKRMQQAHPHCQVVNGYGPTENTTFTCCYRVPPEADLSRGVPVGFPINNTRIYVLDGHMELAPVGVAGELYAGGDGLARGYLGKPQMTAEKFVPNPFSPGGGGRLYRTGDLVRWNKDGALEFLGRIDRQVKIRGFRIEPEEIEVTLGQTEGIKQCAVLVREDGPGEKRLVAYVVGNGTALDAAALRRELARRLPDYMVPAVFVILDALPLTANGKVDRKALPAPERRSTEYRAPDTPQERMLCAIYSEVLRLEQVGANDDFFEIGGHSLLATRLVSQVRARMEVDLALRDVFVARTVKELAVVVHALSLKLGKTFNPGIPADREFENLEEFEEEEI
jgi:nonribosomal peptide synthetase DhbF